MAIQLHPRLQLIQAYLSSSRNFPISPFSVLRGVLKPPCTFLGPRFIESIKADGDYYIVQIRSIVTPLYWPRTLPMFDLYKVLTETFYERDWHYYETIETLVSPGDNVLDCGAAEGIFTLRALDRAAFVAAFEPTPVFVDSLRRTFGHRPDVAIIPCALGAEEAEGHLSGCALTSHITRTGSGPVIPITTIDRWVETQQRPVHFIKGDLEGMELDVLSGARATIARHRPKIAFTTYHQGNNWKDVVSLVRSVVPDYRYRIKGIAFNGSRARPVMIHLWTE
jgi:FkbM family methyltransferase